MFFNKNKKAETKSSADTGSYNRFEQHKEVLSKISKSLCRYAVKCYEISTDAWSSVKNATYPKVSEYISCEVSNSDICFYNNGHRGYNYSVKYESYGMANLKTNNDVREFIKALVPYLEKDFPEMIRNSLSVIPYKYKIAITYDRGFDSVWGADSGFQYYPEISFDITFETGIPQKKLKEW